MHAKEIENYKITDLVIGVAAGAISSEIIDACTSPANRGGIYALWPLAAAITVGLGAAICINKIRIYNRDNERWR